MLISERYATATIADNLKLIHESSALDSIVGMGLSGNTIANILWRLKYGNNRHEYSRAIDLLNFIFEKKRRWETDIRRQAVKTALDWWAFDVCTNCCGRRYELLESHHNVLSDNLCHVCDGTGKHKIQVTQQIEQPVDTVLNYIFKQERQTASKLIRLLGYVL